MNINQFKQLLGYLYREQYKDDRVIQVNLLELGWAIDRLLKKGQLTPFDNYDERKKIIFKEMEWSDKWG